MDSEPLAMRTLVAAIAKQGFEITEKNAYRDFLGRSMETISASVDKTHGSPLAPAAFEAMRHELYALYRQELRANPGLPEVLGKLTSPFCVASSSTPERIRLSLELTGLLPFFGDRIYSATMVQNGKPAPDLFLHAAAAMGVSPERCLVIEDSPAGITAAKAAGMAVFAYLGGSHVGPAGLRALIENLRPNAIFDDMQALPDLVSSLGTEKKAP